MTTPAGGLPPQTSVDTPGEKPSGTTSDASQQGGESSAVAERALHDPTPAVTATGVERTGMFGVHGSGDTSGLRPAGARGAHPGAGGTALWRLL